MTRTQSLSWRLGLMALLLAGSLAQAKNNELAEIGEENMRAGKYAAAITAFEKISPSYEHIFAINFDLAWCYYLTGAYEKAIPLFETLSGIRAPSEEIKQQSLFLLAECLARAAEELETKDPNRRQHIQRAIKLQTQFQADYPKSSFVPNSLYGRAYAFYLDAQMDKAEADLFTLIKTYATSTAARDGKYLLANVYSQQALDLLQQNKTSASKPLMDKARTLFSQLSNITGNLALANDSTFALADTWFQAGFYMEAISYFRAVRPKVDVLQDLHQQLTALEQKRAQEAGSGQSFALTSAEIDKIKAQMTIIGDTPDLMLSSYFRIALSFFELRRMDEMRIICRHLLPFMEGTQKEETGFLIINSFLEDHNPAAAAEALDDFQHTSGTSRPIAEMASLAIGQQFMEQGDLAAALTQFIKSVIEYPAGPGLEDAFYMKFSAEYLLEQYAAAIQTARASQAAFPEGKYILNALYLQAMSQAALREWAAALSVIEDLLRRSPSEAFPSLDEATYQKGWFLYQQALSQEQASAAGAPSGKQAILLEAIKQFEFFLERYPDSRLHPIGMYQLALTLNAAQETGRAVDTLRQLAQSHPQHTIAPTALFQIAVIYYEQEDVPRMADALDLLVQEYPTAPIMPEAYFWLGWVTKKNNHFDEATEYFSQSLALAPGDSMAPECLLQMANCQWEKAYAMGMPTMLSDERKALFRASVLESAQLYEDLLAHYPEASQAQEAIPAIARNLFTLVLHRLLPEEAATAYFQQAQMRHRNDSITRSRLAFSLGSYLLKNQEKDKALLAFKEAFSINPAVRLSAVMLADYAEALKDAHLMPEAEEIYNKIIAQYADDPQAIAPAWFGIADIKYRQDDFQAAQQAFEKVLQEFPWYEPGKQGKVKLATILERHKDYAAAEQMFTEVWKQERGEARISAMLGVSRCQIARAEEFRQQGSIASMKTMIKAADDNVSKIIILYEAFPDYVSEALKLKGQLYELSENPVQARETYDRLLREYKNYPAAKEALEQLQKLGGPLTAPGVGP